MKLAPYPADAEAAAGARTVRQPHNLEEQAKETATMRKKRHADPEPTDHADAEAAAGEAGEGTQPIPEEARAGFFARTAAALTTGFCGFCNRTATPDPRKTHKCACCRRELLPEYAAKREKERAAVRAKAAAEASAKK